LTQIDVNNQNIVWGVNRHSNIYTANGGKKATKKVKKSNKQMKAKKPKTLKKSKKATATKKTAK